MTNNIETDTNKVNELLTRGISEVYPSKEELDALLKEGKRIRAYLGMDATGPELHLGHVSKLIIMERLRSLGHDVIILFGDFTAMIGDPSDKEAARKQLSREQVEENLATWREQVAKIVKLEDDDNPARILRNSEWLAGLNFENILEISSHFTVQQMIERDMFERRINNEQPVYLHEFMYPLMQGYDSVEMEVDLEVGGSDQIFNMLAGRTLLRKIRNKEKYVLASELLEDPETGKKLMSKSEGDQISVNDEPNQIFGKVMSLPDKAIIPFFKDVTLVPAEKVGEVEKSLEEGANPRDIKMELAEEITSMCHDLEIAKNAKEEFIKTFQKGEIPENVAEIKLQKGQGLSDALKADGIVSSKTEFNRLLNDGAIKDMDTGEKINEDKLNETCTLKIGKKRFVRIITD